MRIGVNGLGRIGRTLLRLLWERGDHEVVHVNDLNADVENLAYLLRYDSNFGRFGGTVEGRASCLTVRDERRCWTIGCSASDDTREVAWEASGAELVFEATGTSTNNVGCRHYVGGGVRHAVITHTEPRADATVLFGVNEDALDLAAHEVISASICDAVALAPVLKAIHDAFGIEHAFVTTLHPWLSYQNLVDGAVRCRAQPGAFHPDWALGRASPGALIPKSTTAGAAIEGVLPELRGRISSNSYRVPTAVVCYGDVAAVLANPADREHAIRVLGRVSPYLRLSDEPLVSTDLVADAASGTVDTRWLTVADGRHLKAVVGYDNEWGYCSRLADLVDRIAALRATRAACSTTSG